MIDENIVCDLLRKYLAYIKIGNEAFVNTYEFEGSPLFAKRQKKIPAKGSIDTASGPMSFRFHGDGCHFNFGKIDVDFDYYCDNGTYNVIDSYGFYIFIKSYPSAPEELRDAVTIDEYFLILQSAGYIIRVDRPLYEIYEVLL